GLVPRRRAAGDRGGRGARARAAGAPRRFPAPHGPAAAPAAARIARPDSAAAAPRSRGRGLSAGALPPRGLSLFGGAGLAGGDPARDAPQPTPPSRHFRRRGHPAVALALDALHHLPGLRPLGCHLAGGLRARVPGRLFRAGPGAGRLPGSQLPSAGRGAVERVMTTASAMAKPRAYIVSLA